MLTKKVYAFVISLHVPQQNDRLLVSAYEEFTNFVRDIVPNTLTPNVVCTQNIIDLTICQ